LTAAVGETASDGLAFGLLARQDPARKWEKRMLKKPVITLALLMISVAPSAWAHGPIEINATPEKIWTVVGNFHDMSWDPDIVKTEGTGGNEPDSTRTLTLKNGGQITEQLSKYSGADFTYSTFLPHNDPKVLPVADFSTVLTVTAEAGGKSTVEWRAAAYRGYQNNDPPADLNDDAAVAAMTAYLKDGLAGLKKKVEGH
jgi:hypothetical protein